MQNDERKSDTGDLRTWKRKDRKCLRTRCDRSFKRENSHHGTVFKGFHGNRRYGDRKTTGTGVQIIPFEKSPIFFDQLSEEEKDEARINIRNGLNFAKKVLVTGECDILILDEILGILDEGIISLEELKALICQARQSEAELIMTGTVYPQELDEYADEITKVQTRYEHCEG